MEQKKGWFTKLKQGLSKTRETWLSGVFSGDERINADFYEELEEALIMGDVGMEVTEDLLDALRERVKAEKLTKRMEARNVLQELIAESMRPQTAFAADQGKAVLLIVGVNGVGKTTSIGKLAHIFKDAGRRPMLAAADTFRAAAADQLAIWAERSGVPMVRHAEGADPAAVVFDAAASFKAKNCDVLICDTAGRLHNKKNLMNELSKIQRVLQRELPDIPCETLLVIDATTGQNAIMQAKAFAESTGLTGIILTKLDGTAKGGVAVAVQSVLNIPVRFVGVGEGIEDMMPFDPSAFAQALLGTEKAAE